MGHRVCHFGWGVLVIIGREERGLYNFYLYVCNELSPSSLCSTTFVFCILPHINTTLWMVHMCSRKMYCVDPDENQLKSSPKHSLVISMKYYCGRPGLAFSHAGILQTSRRPWFVGVVGSSETGTETLKGWGHTFFFPGTFQRVRWMWATATSWFDLVGTLENPKGCSTVSIKSWSRVNPILKWSKHNTSKVGCVVKTCMLKHVTSWIQWATG